MRPVPFVYTTDMQRSLTWYQKVIPSAVLRSESKWWSELDINGSVLAFHATETITRGGSAGVAFVAEESLDELVDRLAAVGIEPHGDIEDQPFGRSIRLIDPDGFEFQVNEYSD